jgi:hypothetical protein
VILELYLFWDGESTVVEANKQKKSWRHQNSVHPAVSGWTDGSCKQQNTEVCALRGAHCQCQGCPRHGGPRVSAGRLAGFTTCHTVGASRVTSSKQGTFAWLERLRSLAPRPRLLFPRSLAAVLKPAERCRVSVTTALLALIILFPTIPSAGLMDRPVERA